MTILDCLLAAGPQPGQMAAQRANGKAAELAHATALCCGRQPNLEISQYDFEMDCPVCGKINVPTPDGGREWVEWGGE